MADATVTYKKGKLYQLDMAQLQTDPNQPRKYLDPQALDELAASIAQHGVLEPILFRVQTGADDPGIGGHDPISPEIGIVSPDSVQAGIVSPDSLFIVAGERRVEAAKKAGLTTIPAIFVEGNHAEIALVENLLRQDLTVVEEAEALQSLMTEQSYTHEQLAGIIGKARVTITETLSLNRLPQEIRDACRSNPKIVKSVLVEIARKKQERGMVTAWNIYQEKINKQQAGRQKRVKRPEDAAAVIQWISKTVAKLDGLDTSAWTEDEKATLNQTLMDLGESIRAVLEPSESDNLA